LIRAVATGLPFMISIGTTVAAKQFADSSSEAVIQ
jgi:hypothetical protein